MPAPTQAHGAQEQKRAGASPGAEAPGAPEQAPMFDSPAVLFVKHLQAEVAALERQGRLVDAHTVVRVRMQGPAPRTGARPPRGRAPQPSQLSEGNTCHRLISLAYAGQNPGGLPTGIGGVLWIGRSSRSCCTREVR